MTPLEDLMFVDMLVIYHEFAQMLHGFSRIVYLHKNIQFPMLNVE
jgi:hypothetical protein